MGTHCSSELPRGHISKFITMKLLLLTVLAAVALAEPEAEARYYGYNPGSYGYNFGSYGYPYGSGYRSYGFPARSFTYRSPQGLRGKRSAEAEPEAEADAEPRYYGYGSYGYNFGSYGYGLPGRSFAHFGGHYLGKRSAEADAEPRYYGYGYNFRSYGYPYGYRAYGRGVAAHPTGNSFTYRSVQGFGK